MISCTLCSAHSLKRIGDLKSNRFLWIKFIIKNNKTLETIAKSVSHLMWSLETSDLCAVRKRLKTWIMEMNFFFFFYYEIEKNVDFKSHIQNAMKCMKCLGGEVFTTESEETVCKWDVRSGKDSYTLDLTYGTEYYVFCYVIAFEILVLNLLLKTTLRVNNLMYNNYNQSKWEEMFVNYIGINHSFYGYLSFILGLTQKKSFSSVFYFNFLFCIFQIEFKTSWILIISIWIPVEILFIVISMWKKLTQNVIYVNFLLNIWFSKEFQKLFCNDFYF